MRRQPKPYPLHPNKTLYPTPYTLHPNKTLYPTPYTLTKPYTLHLTPYTLHPNETLYATPYTVLSLTQHYTCRRPTSLARDFVKPANPAWFGVDRKFILLKKNLKYFFE